ncbi:hypothetical protein C922_05598 [Plasmodium inui San Antonio 1]|uniref:Pv-fam-d protein n=1 Tax=Plasmodium inui San Antonio 1 TaxID=1237626 RepID=W6ZXL0_9APIC|nr:hypothetical protein C922_05598 [Plasmodium inui San Antonio 1]EUD64023.1 hypothetical protein C922_05598 [Plasmodium inui San Antonio 1]
MLNIFHYFQSICYKENSSDSSYNVSHRTALAESDVLKEQKYAEFKNKIEDFLQQNDDTSGETLNALVNDDEFTENLNHFIHRYASEAMLLRSRQEKGFQKDFGSYSSSSKYEERTDQFDSYDSSQDSLYELKRENSRTTKPVNNAVNRNELNSQQSVDEQEYNIPIQISQNPDRTKFIQSLIYDSESRKKKKSWIHGILHKLHSKFESEVERFLRIVSGRIRIYKGKGFSGYFRYLRSKYRVFNPLITSVGLSILAICIGSILNLKFLTGFGFILAVFTFYMILYYIFVVLELK